MRAYALLNIRINIKMALASVDFKRVYSTDKDFPVIAHASTNHFIRG